MKGEFLVSVEEYSHLKREKEKEKRNNGKRKARKK
jgi:hypothetical protein